MDEQLKKLVKGVNIWRAKNVEEYWVDVGYMGSAVNRLGDHTLTYANGSLWHLWEGTWRELKQGSDFWLYSVPGAFAWARDMISKVDHEGRTLELTINETYGYVEFLRMRAEKRDANNFTFEVRRFETGAHPDFEG